MGVPSQTSRKIKAQILFKSLKYALKAKKMSETPKAKTAKKQSTIGYKITALTGALKNKENINKIIISKKWENMPLKTIEATRAPAGNLIAFIIPLLLYKSIVDSNVTC